MMYTYRITNPDSNMTYSKPEGEEFDTQEKAVNAGLKYLENRFYFLSEFESVVQVTDNITLVDGIFEIRVMRAKTDSLI